MADPTPSMLIDKGDTAFVLVCVTFVFLMSPALGFFYAGLARAKNALSLMYLTVISVAVVSFQWYLIGYSLTFSNTGGVFIGDSVHFLLRGVGELPQIASHTIPASAFMIFQAMFACLTPALAFGSAAERMSLGPAILFIFVWTTLVYDIITYWVWSPNGWLAVMGVMDYAGGITVHISSGLAAVAYAVVLGKRRDYNQNVNTPHNVSFVFLGMALLWFGWFAFNAGSALGANARGVNSLIDTHLSGCVGAIVWVLMDYRHTRKWSIIGLCTGAVAGLATITPGSGFVSPSSSLAFGALGSIVCNLAVQYKHKYRFDDALDVFAVHYIGGLVGLLLTGIFAQRSIIALGYPDDTPWDSLPKGGWLDGHWMQVPIQLAAIGSVSAWSFVVTYLILIVINLIPFLRLRLNDEDELIGTDWAEMGERAYGYLPFEEEQLGQNCSASGSSDVSANPQVIHGEESSTQKKKSSLGHFRRFLKANNDRAILNGLPNLVEQPAIGYENKEVAVVNLSNLSQPETNIRVGRKRDSQQLQEKEDLPQLIHVKQPTPTESSAPSETDKSADPATESSKSTKP
ncbi:ammonium transporter AmtB-like domain-containing protein [Phycomyces nitens]|nr:ammonium transporter AmtB-like domain-containing protein [Phycomyces nitens]